MRGAFADIDKNKKIIRVNKKAHKLAKKSKKGRFGFSKKDSTLINSIAHELEHKKDWRASEKQVEKRAKRKVKKMSKKQKAKLYKKFQ